MFRPDIILSGWLDSKHKLCNETPHPLFVLIEESVLSNILPSSKSPHPLYVLIQESVLSHILPSTMSPHPLFVLIQESVLSHILPSTMSPHPLFVLIQESVLSHIPPTTNSLTLSLSGYRSQSCPTFYQQLIPSPSLCFDKRVHSGRDSVSEGINVCVENVWCLSKGLQQANLASDVSHWFHLLLVLQL